MYALKWVGTLFRTFAASSPVLRALVYAATLAWPAAASAFTLSVVDQNGTPIPAKTGYRYLIEEDTTQHPKPGALTNNILIFQFHKSWMSPVIAGTDADASLAKWTPDPTKNYIISVVPNFTQDSFGTYFASYNIRATTIQGAHNESNGNAIAA